MHTLIALDIHWQHSYSMNVCTWNMSFVSCCVVWHHAKKVRIDPNFDPRVSGDSIPRENHVFFGNRPYVPMFSMEIYFFSSMEIFSFCTSGRSALLWCMKIQSCSDMETFQWHKKISAIILISICELSAIYLSHVESDRWWTSKVFFQCFSFLSAR
jgi:hypothetical protein